MLITLASHNKDKLQEFKEIFKGTNVTLQGPKDPAAMQRVVEDGDDYKANALIKARALWQDVQGFVLADDSGLSCDVLDGYPGLYSARFAGEESSYASKYEALWQLLKKYPQERWTASFICALCLLDPKGEAHFYEGEVKGLILPEKRGSNGFGYDPIFYLPELGLTTAELTPEEKHRLSHRGLAAKKMLQDLLERKIASLGDFT